LSLKVLLTLSGGLEASAGTAALIAPDLVITVLLGVPAESASVVLARFFGIGILSLGVSALQARHDTESRAGISMAYAMTCYNLVAALLLIWAVSVVGLGGVILWVAGLGHAMLGGVFLHVLLRGG
jgi:hypothetical protein